MKQHNNGEKKCIYIFKIHPFNCLLYFWRSFHPVKAATLVQKMLRESKNQESSINCFTDPYQDFLLSLGFSLSQD